MKRLLPPSFSRYDIKMRREQIINFHSQKSKANRQRTKKSGNRQRLQQRRIHMTENKKAPDHANQKFASPEALTKSFAVFLASALTNFFYLWPIHFSSARHSLDSGRTHWPHSSSNSGREGLRDLHVLSKPYVRHHTASDAEVFFGMDIHCRPNLYRNCNWKRSFH